MFFTVSFPLQGTITINRKMMWTLSYRSSCLRKSFWCPFSPNTGLLPSSMERRPKAKHELQLQTSWLEKPVVSYLSASLIPQLCGEQYLGVCGHTPSAGISAVLSHCTACPVSRGFSTPVWRTGLSCPVSWQATIIQTQGSGKLSSTPVPALH